jgi:hypothetical protein
VPFALEQQFPFTPRDPRRRFFDLLPVIIPFGHDDLLTRKEIRRLPAAKLS